VESKTDFTSSRMKQKSEEKRRKRAAFNQKVCWEIQRTRQGEDNSNN